MNLLSSGEEGSRPLSGPCPCSLHRRTKCASSSIASIEGGGQCVVTLKNGACTVQAGVAPALEATIAVTAADYVQIVTGAVLF